MEKVIRAIVDENLHMEVKIQAAKMNITINDLLIKFVKDGLKTCKK